MKKCTKCSKTQPLSQFNIGRSYQDGLHGWCKTCNHHYRLALNLANTRVCVTCGTDFSYHTTRKRCLDCCPAHRTRTFEECQIAALDCKTRTDFSNRYNREYCHAKRSKILDQICSHMYVKPKKPTKKTTPKKQYTLEQCLEVAKEYKHICDLSKNNLAVYTRIHRKKWTKQCFSHMVPANTRPTTKEYCLKVAKTCKTKTEFGRKYRPQYTASVENGWLTEIHDLFPAFGGFGYNRSAFVANCDLHSNGYGVFYLIFCYDSEETFYKIGITRSAVGERYYKTSQLPYDYDILVELCLPAEFCWNLERYYKTALKYHHYSPTLCFDGSFSECFQIHDSAPELVTLLNYEGI